jgi:hypothetical protein
MDSVGTPTIRSPDISAEAGNNGVVSIEGETYEQWRERTASKQPGKPTDTRYWDIGVIVLLGVFFVWIGGTAGWIGLGLVAVLAAEQVLQTMVARRTGEASPATHPRLVQARGATLLVTLALGGWLVWVVGGEAAPLPLLLVLLDVKDDRSFLRWALEGARRTLRR